MTCYSPLKGYDLGLKTKNLKPSYKITSYETVLYNIDGTEMEYIGVPCGHCLFFNSFKDIPYFILHF